MLTIRKDIPIPIPEPFSIEAADQLFERLRKELGLPPEQKSPCDLDPSAWRKWAEDCGAEKVEF